MSTEPDRPGFEELTKEEYLGVQNVLGILAQAALAVNPDTLERFIRTAERADTVGPFVDPTTWMQGREGLLRVIRHARALAGFRKELEASGTVTLT